MSEDQRYEIVNLENLFTETELRKAIVLLRGGVEVPEFWAKRELAAYAVFKGWLASDIRKVLVVK